MIRRNTRERILDAAERLLAERGYATASVREVTKRARANLASAHYHFRSKRGLAQAVMTRRLDPMNAERLKRLDAIPPARRRSPEAILDAFVRPVFDFHFHAPQRRGARNFMRLMGRTFSEPALRALLPRQFDAVARRFGQAFSRALPRLSPDALFLRLHFCVGAMAHTLLNAEVLRKMSKGAFDPDDRERTIVELVHFLACGFRAQERRAR